MATGHAAGTVAALAARVDGIPRRVGIALVQETLQAQRAILFYP
jgi:hypothetical protein